ncbi:hypothetical protein BC938DRAFT_470552, partial [Jimgerdemannia flammicorona]
MGQTLSRNLKKKNHGSLAADIVLPEGFKWQDGRTYRDDKCLASMTPVNNTEIGRINAQHYLWRNFQAPIGKELKRGINVLQVGHLGCVEAPFHIHEGGPQTKFYIQQLNLAVKAQGLNGNIGKILGSGLSVAGLEEIHYDYRSCPLGWGHPELGRLTKLNLCNLMKQMKPRVTDALNMPDDKYDTIVAEVDDELGERYQGFANVEIYVARKPGGLSASKSVRPVESWFRPYIDVRLEACAPKNKRKLGAQVNETSAGVQIPLCNKTEAPIQSFLFRRGLCRVIFQEKILSK